MPRTRIVWLIGTKLAIALALSLSPNVSPRAVEYRVLDALADLEPGAHVTLLGQSIGRIVAIDRRGDTTALRVRYRRGVERLPGSRTVHVRRMGIDGSVALEISAASRSVRGPLGRSFALGGWLTICRHPVLVMPPREEPGPAEPRLPPLFHHLPLPAPAAPTLINVPFRRS